MSNGWYSRLFQLGKESFGGASMLDREMGRRRDEMDGLTKASNDEGDEELGRELIICQGWMAVLMVKRAMNMMAATTEDSYS